MTIYLHVLWVLTALCAVYALWRIVCRLRRENRRPLHAALLLCLLPCLLLAVSSRPRAALKRAEGAKAYMASTSDSSFYYDTSGTSEEFLALLADCRGTPALDPSRGYLIDDVEYELGASAPNNYLHPIHLMLMKPPCRSFFYDDASGTTYYINPAGAAALTARMRTLTEKCPKTPR